MATEPRETELKFVLAPGEGAKVPLTAPLAGSEGRASRFSALYFDTPTRELSRHGLGLRLRREGRHWRATLKASGDSSGGLHQRPEWEYPMPGPQLDLSRFAGTPLAELPGADTLHERLAPILATEFRRTRWQLEPQPGSRVEVALDQGRIAARGRESPIEEVEIEVYSQCRIHRHGTNGTWPFGRRFEDQVATRFLALFLDMEKGCGAKPCNLESLGNQALWDSAPIVPKTPPNPLKNDKEFLKEFPYLAEPW